MAKESSFKNMVLTLFVITSLSSLTLALVYELTKEAIKLGEIKKINEGIALVVPAFDNNPSAERYAKFVDGDSLVFYPAKLGGEVVGTAVQTFTNAGFSGKISLMVGFLPNGTIKNVVVISHSETPGLGDKIENSKSTFSSQFTMKNPATFKMSVTKDGGDVDAITASTISSKAYCDAMSRAYKVYFEEVMGLGEWDGATGATKKDKSN